MSCAITNQRCSRVKDGIAVDTVTVVCDTAKDLPRAQASWDMGSIAWVLETGDFYGLNSSGNWVLQTRRTSAAEK